ncbi:COG4280 domain-containing protein [Rhizobium sp. WYJ-E13]|uniref:COG4280 domain-containing protein n=1 Tax=unclassified Rhizobium TaxID=2613769 RepID=UPI001C1EE658|nr:TMEM165/GDT1 family protein [Rhizobium sp. WYJ-E13]QWW70070.1 TMEM165/GDT1 family protein [Rhizobium sp. WYJ-E13]
MTTITSITSTMTASFLGSFVEVVEAFTIILAVGVTRSWRSAFIGAGLALSLLAVLVLVFGPLLGLIPIDILQFVIGTLLILFGMRWLRKAILRAAGFIALHDEEKAFASETDALARQSTDRRADFLAGTAAFKAVLLEGIEVVFIVIATGARPGMLPYAAIGALVACIAVLVIGLAVHKPLSSVPENTLKFIVGLLLTAFGIFWVGEGIGTPWPGEDLSLPVLFGGLAIFSFIAVRWLRQYYDLHAEPVAR